MRLSAYYYGFDETGNRAIDVVLSAVAWAGKCFHNTSEWSADEHDMDPREPEHRGKTCAEWIQNAATDAAAAHAQAIADAEARGYARCQADVLATLEALPSYREDEFSGMVRRGEHVGAAK